MAQIRPFPAIRFAPERVDLAVTLAPPTGALDEALVAALYARDPRNVVRIVRNRSEDGDGPGARERRAAFFVADWLRAGVLVRDVEPALYLLRQTFPREGSAPLVRQGFYAALDVEDPGLLPALDDAPVPEKTDAAVTSRRALGVDVEPVRLLHPDPEARVARAFEVELEREADVRFSFGGAVHELWNIDDETTTARVAQLVAEQPLHVVGGQAALRVAQAHARREPACRHALAFLSALAEPGAADADLAAPGADDEEGDEGGDAFVLRAPRLATLAEIADEEHARVHVRYDPRIPAGLVLASLASLASLAQST